MTPARLLFDGWIAGTGTTGGTRLVLGHWARSPFGGFSDVMVERPDGRRLLLAPTRETADFIADTYAFDEVRVVPVAVRRQGAVWSVTAAQLDLRFASGRRSPLGILMRAVPKPLAMRPVWATVTDPLARLLLPGVRTRGSAGRGRREWYCVRDAWPVTAVGGVFEGWDLGAMAPVDPPVRFGFGSTPRPPTLVRVMTAVQVGGG